MYSLLKRTFDVSSSTIILLFISPLIITISVLIRWTSKGPILYRGERTGKANRLFNLYKFRTMLNNAEGGHTTALNDPRLTQIGRFLRKYKLDEIPQLVNVILGDISLVGPRPQVKYYTDKYKDEEKIILSVKPGITDLATIYFMDMDSIVGVQDVDEKYEKEIEPIKNKLRVHYVRNRSLMLDFKILIETLFRLFGIKGITDIDREF